MAIKMVREPSETPNINNIDDIVPMRYAYGNQNGYVIGKGTEISNTVNGLNFTVNSGRLVLQGVECDIDASGVTITIDNIATKRYYVVYLQVNLGTNTASILDTHDTATYPSIDAGDDLTENTTGIARLPLYRFIATSGVISNVNKVVESVKYIDESFIKNVKVNDAEHADNADNATNANKVATIYSNYTTNYNILLKLTEFHNKIQNREIKLLNVHPNSGGSYLQPTSVYSSDSTGVNNTDIRVRNLDFKKCNIERYGGIFDLEAYGECSGHIINIQNSAHVLAISVSGTYSIAVSVSNSGAETVQLYYDLLCMEQAKANAKFYSVHGQLTKEQLNSIDIDYIS